MAFLAALVAGAGLPASADATLTPRLISSGKTVSITGDERSDIATIRHIGASLSHNMMTAGLVSNFDFDIADGSQQVPADGTWRIEWATGGGDDRITMDTPEVAGVFADLGEGNDIFQGEVGIGPSPFGTEDEVHGGPGHDRLAGGHGDDEVLGGADNDLIVHDNGDGDDEIDGEAGADVAQVNGSPLAENFTIRADAGRLRLDRTNAGRFFALFAATTERVEINGVGGNDQISGAAGVGALGMTLALDGGAGEDRIEGGDGADEIRGGDDADFVSGGGGDDRVAGDRGADAMAGGEGDDLMVWNDGDGTDTADGDAGFDVLQVRGGHGGDVIAVRASGERARVEGSTDDAFGIDFTAEALDVQTLSGDDTVTASGAPPVQLEVDAGAGADVVSGDAGGDVLRGGAGADVLTGGGGADVIDGGDGDDRAEARDGVTDFVNCGAGADTAVLDAVGVDGEIGCETADRTAVAPPPGPPPAPVTPPAAVTPAAGAARITTRSVKVTRRRARIRLTCPAGAAACHGELTLLTRRAVRLGRARVIAVLGSARYRIPAGGAATVTVRLTKSLPALAGRKPSLAALVIGPTLGSSRRLTLRRGSRW